MNLPLLLLAFSAGLAQVPAGPAAAATCEVGPGGVVSRSGSGVAQVSNLALIDMRASVSRRPNPDSGVRHGLSAEVTVETLSGGAVPAEVPSSIVESGGGADTRSEWVSFTLEVPSSIVESGGGADTRSEWVSFTLEIPIDPAERDAAIRDYMDEVIAEAAASADPDAQALSSALQDGRTNASRALAQGFLQHRVGSFRVQCRVLDEGEVIGTSSIDLDVVFRGGFFEQEQYRSR